MLPICLKDKILLFKFKFPSTRKGNREMLYYELKLKSGAVVHACGFSVQDAAENAGVNWNDVVSYEDSSKISFEHHHSSLSI